MSKNIRKKCKNKNHIDDYYYSYTLNDKLGNPVKYYFCKQCKIENDKEIERLTKICTHNQRQKDESREKWRIVFEEKKIKREESYKNDMWDHFIEKELRKGMKFSHQFKFPKEMIQLKRASMKLERLIKETRKSIIDEDKKQRELEQERIDRLNKPIMKCRRHGALFMKDMIKNGQNKLKCRECRNEIQRNHYRRNKEEVLKKQAEYRKNNPERIKEIKHNSWRKCNVINQEYETT